jgi:ribose transport system ATP-binding protein
MAMGNDFLSMQKISKRFPGVQALHEVNFNCLPGEVHALVGENGAGKSTLMKILAGVYHPDEGKIILHGQETIFRDPKTAQDQGISTIYQEFNLVPELDVAENIFLGREPRRVGGLFIDSDSLYKRAGELLEWLQTEINPRTQVKNLSVAHQQMVEIAKALSLNSRILIMDEPSAVVSGKELEALFRIIFSLRNQGKTVIYISHRLEEIFQIADRATVLKDGKFVGTVKPKEIDKPTLIKMMVGRSLKETFPEKEKGERREILVLQELGREGILKRINLGVYTGEILGIAGLVGSGRTQLAKAIFGVDPVDRGEITFNGEKIKNLNPKDLIARGIGFLPEDRRKEGLISCLSVAKNITLLVLDKIQRWGFIRPHKEERLVQEGIKKFNIATPSGHQEIQYLSGGNQQKAILAKWINAHCRLLILDEPTRGIDVGAKAEIYELMRKIAKQGTAIIMISSELPELMGMSDRIIVMQDGRIRGELSSSEATEEEIMLLATGPIGEKT